jgi:hypothetical protein
LSDFVDSHLPAEASAQAGRVPLGSAGRMGRRNLFAGRLNGSITAQILPESPGRQRPTTETAAAACFEFVWNFDIRISTGRVYPGSAEPLWVRHQR